MNGTVMCVCVCVFVCFVCVRSRALLWVTVWGGRLHAVAVGGKGEERERSTFSSLQHGGGGGSRSSSLVRPDHRTGLSASSLWSVVAVIPDLSTPAW